MCSAIWSCSPEKMLDYPALDFVRFFANHGLFKLSKRPLWKSIIGGSVKYVDGIVNSSSFVTKLNTEIIAIKKNKNKFSYKTIFDNPLKKNNKISSSSIIRINISKGQIETANRLLGREWSIVGKVEKGYQRGRKIGFPTCNIKLNNTF